MKPLFRRKRRIFELLKPCYYEEKGYCRRGSLRGWENPHLLMVVLMVS